MLICCFFLEKEKVHLNPDLLDKVDFIVLFLFGIIS